MNRLLMLVAVLPSVFILGNPVPDLSKSGIVGGQKAKLIPYQVSFGKTGHKCGGSIVSNQIVVTAAHCMIGELGYEKYPYWISAGSRTLFQGGRSVRLKDYVIHPNYNATTFDYDIAILYLNNPLVFSRTIQPILMANANDFLETGTMAVISGWGYKQENSKRVARKLMLAQVPIVSKEVCQSTTLHWTERVICAGYQEGGVDACRYDSGGPLVAKGKLFGVISTGDGCGHQNKFGSYISIPVLRLWIDQTISTLKKRNLMPNITRNN